MSKLFYITYQQLVQGVRDWSHYLPEYSAVVGVPRSGLLPATILAQHRNIPLVPLELVLRGERPWNVPLRRSEGKARCTDFSAEPKPVLVMEDTVHTGTTLQSLQARMPKIGEQWQYASVLASDAEAVRKAGIQLDHVWMDVDNTPVLTEWTIFHVPYMAFVASDLDGVLASDWQGDEVLDTSRYFDHVVTASPLIRPTFQLGAIVTGRLEQYRGMTQNWLAKYGIKYRSLVMHPAKSSLERGGPDQIARWKAEVFKHLGLSLFIESDTYQVQVMKQVLPEANILDWGRQLYR